MNSFDNIQCEETANAQLCFNMEEMAIYQEWLEEREREAQQELDEIFDELYDAEIDFQNIGNGPADGMTAIGGDSLGFLSSISPLEYTQTRDWFDSRHPSMMDLEIRSHDPDCEKSQRFEVGAIPLGYVVRGRQCGTD